MYNYIKKEISASLTEISQPSPVRYKVLLETNGVLTEASRWFKCTDYFNDVVIATTCKRFFIVYGFDNSSLAITGDLFVAIKDYGPTKLFTENLTVINRWLLTMGHEPQIEIVPKEEIDGLPDGHLVLQIPRYYITNTAYMSLVMLLIRSCTYKQEVTEKNIFEIDGKSRSLFSFPINKSKFFKLINPINKELLDEKVFFAQTGNSAETLKSKESVKTIYEAYIHNAGIQGTVMSVDFIQGLQ